MSEQEYHGYIVKAKRRFWPVYTYEIIRPDRRGGMYYSGGIWIGKRAAIRAGIKFLDEWILVGM